MYASVWVQDDIDMVNKWGVLPPVLEPESSFPQYTRVFLVLSGLIQFILAQSYPIPEKEQPVHTNK